MQRIVGGDVVYSILAVNVDEIESSRSENATDMLLAGRSS